MSIPMTILTVFGCLLMLVAAFAFAEMVRTTLLSKYMPGVPRLRLAISLACIILVINATTMFIEWTGLFGRAEETLTSTSPEANPLMIFLVAHPMWWVYRIVFARFGEYLDGLHPFQRTDNGSQA